MNQTTFPPLTHLGSDLSPAEIAGHALNAFDALRPGETVTLEFNRAPSVKVDSVRVLKTTSKIKKVGR